MVDLSRVGVLLDKHPGRRWGKRVMDDGNEAKRKDHENWGQ